ncbi:MAG: hypothetical protein PWQ22_1581 [Archaeoglobaceae archaeon]|nr:hypothetical protein [Archaeoglobaceae archaeon]
MLIFGHLGITIGIPWLMESKLKIRMNYLLIAIGSLLPDIIDKPIGLIFLENGRVFAHTLIFILILSLLGLKYRKLLYLSSASFLHLIQDKAWIEPKTLLWPFLGTDFPRKIEFQEYVGKVVSEYNPSFSETFIFEVAGILILLMFLKFRSS